MMILQDTRIKLSKIVGKCRTPHDTFLPDTSIGQIDVQDLYTDVPIQDMKEEVTRWLDVFFTYQPLDIYCHGRVATLILGFIIGFLGGILGPKLGVFRGFNRQKIPNIRTHFIGGLKLRIFRLCQDNKHLRNCRILQVNIQEI